MRSCAKSDLGRDEGGDPPKAELELFSTFDFYEIRVPGLGHDFLAEFEHGKARIIENPTTWPLTRKGARKHLLHRFPFWIIYLVRGETLTVIAIMHTSRRPFYWLERV